MYLCYTILISGYSKIISELLFSLLVTILVSSVTLANSYASDMLQESNQKIYDIRDDGVGGDSQGCPTGYAIYSPTKMDQCKGNGKVVLTCPEGFKLVGGGTCNGPWKDCDSMGPGYDKKLLPIIGMTGFFSHCEGPPIEQVQCPPGYHQHPSSPHLCIGPRNP